MTVALSVIPLLPLAGFLLCLLLGPRLGKSFVSAAGVGSVGLATVAAWARLIPYVSGPGTPVVERIAPWISAGNFSVDLSLRLDPLSALMVSFVTFVGFLIHVYSIGYMRHDETDAGYARFFAYMNLFLFAMLTLVLANNFLVMFIGWEGVGLCSYLLIGYYYEKEFAAAAGKKAFVVNRIGDFGFLLGMFGVFSLFGTLDFDGVFSRAAADPTRFAPGLTAVCLLLFLGAMGKSAQVPLHVWLPDAMAGPTPVSALIHAATMVTAGVYMVTRCNVLFRLAPEAMLVVAVVGGVTAIFAAIIAIAQTDIKRVLAYSTVSQLGYMFLACGVGAYVAGMFHVLTHAFFKACLFLGSGAVIHALGGEQDVRRMGGLAPRLPVTYRTFLVATLALSGIPPLAGFFSKDAILTAVFAAHRPILFAIGLFTAGLTAFYMFRLVSLTFSGEFRGTPEQAHHVHDAPPTMTLPLVVLAFLSTVGGFLGLPEVFGERANRIATFLAPVLPPVFFAGRQEAGHALPTSTEWLLIGVSVAVAVGGLLLAWNWYAKEGGRPAAAIAARFPALYALVADAFRIDWLYDVLIVRPFAWLARVLWKVVDVLIIDGVLNAGAFLVELTGDALRFLQTGNVRNYALTFLLGVVALVLIVFGGM
ncbi:MAG TPA: NADH-quinone oxidoreductase subunit L [Thermoanaerobaculia bacterium]|nr:NADH-quinone oxidoreductase subunit L [Thermoanaerobaculia bacterium]HEV8608897.1 NADH-quinone oxidoreductase subunit L [Thermoanaerobaculia bacterium]